MLIVMYWVHKARAIILADSVIAKTEKSIWFLLPDGTRRRIRRADIISIENDSTKADRE